MNENAEEKINEIINKGFIKSYKEQSNHKHNNIILQDNPIKFTKLIKKFSSPDLNEYKSNEKIQNINLDENKNENEFNVGDLIEANYKGLGKWYDGVIINKKNNYYCISYNDGEYEYNISNYFIRPQQFQKDKYDLNDIIEANLNGRGIWYQGKIIGINKNDTYNIVYDSGHNEQYVRKRMIRQVKKNDKIDIINNIEQLEQIKFNKGDRIEYNSKNSNNWIKGTVNFSYVQNHINTYNISCDNGEIEISVLEQMIRPIKYENILSKLIINDLVDACNRLKGWYPAKIINVKINDGIETYDVEYIDMTLDNNLTRNYIKKYENNMNNNEISIQIKENLEIKPIINLNKSTKQDIQVKSFNKKNKDIIKKKIFIQ
jgi:hypothetical protein